MRGATEPRTLQNSRGGYNGAYSQGHPRLGSYQVGTLKLKPSTLARDFGGALYGGTHLVFIYPQVGVFDMIVLIPAVAAFAASPPKP